VLVSEFMLQQTQVERVVPIFVRFLALFPTIEVLAAAHLGEVIRAWRGLGYNSRAVRLHAAARAVCSRHGAALPRDLSDLLALPGIGPYTARAIRAFAFDEEEVALDTNLRRVLARVFHGAQSGEVAAHALERTAWTLLGRGSAYQLNSALMDLGATTCTARVPKCAICPMRKVCNARNSRPWERSSPARPGNAERFEESSRYLRGRIVDALRRLPAHQRISLLDLHSALADVVPGRTPDEVSAASAALARDGVIDFDGSYVALPMNLTEV
jgi:A/G-specific adenine glycosylase